MLPELVEKITKSNRETIGKLLADDGACDGNDVFRCLSDNGIYPCVKVRKNAIVRIKTGHILRNLLVIVQRNDFGRWKDSVRMERDGLQKQCFRPLRERLESIYRYSVKFENMVKEMALKTSLNNKIISI